MKKLMLSLIAVAMTAGLVEAQTNVLSKNAVGYVKITAPSNGLALASIPFNSLDSATYPIPQVFGAQLVGGASPAVSDNVIKWDASIQDYVTFWKTLAGQWRQSGQGAVETTNTLKPGEAFWIRNRRSTNQVVFLMGEVPDVETQPTADVQRVPGLQFVSYSYPAEIPINSSMIISNAVRGASPAISDNIIRWDPAIQDYVTYWLPLGTNLWRKSGEGAVPTVDVMRPGDGFWYRRRGATSATWTESKPYTWP